MTKKDYELIAKTIAEQGKLYPFAAERVVMRQTVSRLSAAFMADNPRFNPEKFTRACGF